MISGLLTEKDSEEDVPYATVKIVSYNGGDVPSTIRVTGVVTNDNGQFEFKNLPAGKYTLNVQAMGYTTQDKTIDVSKDYTAVVHFKMEEEGFMTDDVVVSANRNEVSRR